MMLETLGFDVIAVENGREAVFAAEKHRGELRAILLDMTMPELDGLDACRLIRAEDKEIPIVLSSGYNQQEDQKLPHGGQNLHFLKKPYRLDSLRSALQDVLLDRSEHEEA